MYSDAQILEFNLQTERDAAKRLRKSIARFTGELPSAFDDLHPLTTDRLKVGRAKLIQEPDFVETT